MISTGHTRRRPTPDNPDALCSLCPGEHGGPGRCDHTSYSSLQWRFLLAHLEAFTAAYENPDQHAAANELERLGHEWRTRPPRHVCSCPRLNPRTGIVEYHCQQCRRIGELIPRQDVGVEIGRTNLVNAPAPMAMMLDYYAQCVSAA